MPISDPAKPVSGDLPEGVDGAATRARGAFRPRASRRLGPAAGRRLRLVAGAVAGPVAGAEVGPGPGRGRLGLRWWLRAMEGSACGSGRRLGPGRGAGWPGGGGGGWACGDGSGRWRVQPAAVVARRASWLRRRPGKAVTLALTLAAQRSEQKRRDRLVLASMNTPWQAAPAQVPSRSGPI
jgi:hypothetical protein